MRAMVVEVRPEIEQFVFEICSRPEQPLIQILAPNGADEPFHERMGQGNVGDDLISVTSRIRAVCCYHYGGQQYTAEYRDH